MARSISSMRDPAISLSVIVPSDTLVAAFRKLYVGGAGNVSILATNDTVPVVLVGVVAGTVLDVTGMKVMATGTTATNIVAMQ